MRAARYYELSPDEIAFDLVGKRHGFVKRRRRVILRVDPEDPRRTQRPDAPTSTRSQRKREPRAEAAPRTEESPVKESEENRRWQGEKMEPRGDGAAARLPRAEGALALAVEKCLDLTLHFLHLVPEAEVLQGDGCFEVELSGSDAEPLVAGDGTALWALEDLLPRFVYGLVGETVAVRVDANGFRREREAELRRRARAAAEEVDDRGRPKAIEGLSPAERKVIHEALADDPRVTSKSEGRGFRRQIVIRPR